MRNRDSLSDPLGRTEEPKSKQPGNTTQPEDALRICSIHARSPTKNEMIEAKTNAGPTLKLKPPIENKPKPTENSIHVQLVKPDIARALKLK